MFNKTSNPYKFKYIQTGIKGEGIQEVYLPPIPKDKSKILDFGGKWERIPLSDEYEEWLEWERDKNCDSRGKYTKDKRGKEIDPYHEDYIFHPKHVELADQEWDRRGQSHPHRTRRFPDSGDLSTDQGKKSLED